MSNPLQASLVDLIDLNRQASALRLKATHVRARQTGQYLSRMKGRGMEFDESRPYQAGDDVRNIDWRVTARTGTTHTKLFREERERPVLICVDQRLNMFFASQGKFKSVIAAELAALLAWTANRQGDRVGGEIFYDDSHYEYRPRRGQHNVLRFLKTLAGSEAMNAEPLNSLDLPFRRLQRITHPGSLLAIVSDFRGLDEAAKSHLINISRHSEVLLVQVYDALETQLPPKGRYRLSFNRKRLSINTADEAFRQQYATRFTARQKSLEQLHLGYRMGLIRCRTDQLPADSLREQLGVKPYIASSAG